MPSPRGGMRAQRLLIGVVLLLLLTGIAEAWLLEEATSDPYGLTHASALAVGDINHVEALYGKAWTDESVLAWSPDGRQVAVADFGIQVIDVYTGAITAEWTAPGLVGSLAWSPDGQTLAAGVDTAGWAYDGWVILYDLHGIPRLSWPAVHQELAGLAWSPQGDRIIATGNVEYGMWTSVGGLIYHVTNASTTGVSASWSPDGSRVALGGAGGPLILNAATGATVSEGAGNDWMEVAWSPRGDLIAAGGAGGTLALYQPDGTRVESAGGFGGGVLGMPVSWSADGSMIATLGVDGLAIVRAADLTTIRTLVFPMGEFLAGRPPTPTYDENVAWSPSGAAIAATGTTSHPSFRLWGVRHEAVGLPFAVVGLVTALGLGLLFRRDLLWIAMSPDRVGLLWFRTDPQVRAGAVLFLFATVSSIVESLGGNALSRIYGVTTVPSENWYAVTGVLSAPAVLLAAVVAAVTFHSAIWPSSSPRPFAKRVLSVFGYVLLPFLVAFAVANVLIGATLALFPSMTRDLASPLTGGVLGVLLGLGFYLSGRIVRGFPWARSRFPWLGLGASAVASIAVLFGLVVMLVLALNVAHVVPPPGEFQTYGFTVLLAFGFVPLVSLIVGLLTTAAVGSVPSALRFASAGYARARGSAVLELETRRKVLDLVVASPGIHFRALLASSGLGSGTLHYHLSVLEREGYLRHDRQGRVKRFFATLPAGSPPPSELPKAV